MAVFSFNGRQISDFGLDSDAVDDCFETLK